MSWGDSWGRSPSTNSKKVAEAFFDGRSLRRSNAETDGIHYLLDGRAIARRVRPEDQAAEIANALRGESFWLPLMFSFGGAYPTKHVCRHLRALGVECDFTTLRGRDASGNRVKQTIGLMNGRRVELHGWYALEQLAAMPVWKRPVEVERIGLARQLNMELNFG